MAARQIEIGKSSQHIDLAEFNGNAAQPDFVEFKLRFGHPERVFKLTNDQPHYSGGSMSVPVDAWEANFLHDLH